MTTVVVSTTVADIAAVTVTTVAVFTAVAVFTVAQNMSALFI